MTDIKIVLGTIGLLLNIYTNADLTTASVTRLQVECPNGELKYWTCTKTSTPTDGIIKYTLANGDIDNIGTYVIRSNIVLVDGSTYFGDSFNLIVR